MQEEFFKTIKPMLNGIWYKHYRSYDRQDIMQQGYIEALMAHKRYDVTKHKSTYISFIYGGVRGALYKYIKKNMLDIALPHNVDHTIHTFSEYDELLFAYPEIVQEPKNTADLDIEAFIASQPDSREEGIRAMLDNPNLIEASLSIKKNKKYCDLLLRTIEKELKSGTGVQDYHKIIQEREDAI